MVVSVVAGLLISLAKSTNYRFRSTRQKLSAYEFGFEPFGNARDSFDITFYSLGLLFVLFDIEIAIILPWAYDLAGLSPLAFLGGVAFFVVLVLGFLYEIASGIFADRTTVGAIAPTGFAPKRSIGCILLVGGEIPTPGGRGQIPIDPREGSD